ncbi:hypothetical protein CO2235_MP60227 [Cupriavidus oxalaticus]|uniref:Uncharacterized protein n=1 Tax=Cupriavidus oxalaticus TaxID=96344 RepID=A0A375FPD1_9BURK|nr:hypothetical protein CO2235_U310004 [Cupriavidus oxalaticus]SPC22023.1 hypothetical protein CO2235_MP60227 [Cupriavidus oxalaticus]
MRDLIFVFNGLGIPQGYTPVHCMLHFVLLIGILWNNIKSRSALLETRHASHPPRPNPCRHHWRRHHRLQRCLPPDEAGLEGCGAA